MPEYGRASGGQIRIVTKSGSNRFSGSGSYFLRDDKLQANTWARNRSPNALENAAPAPFDYKQYGYSFGGPIPAACSRTSCSSSARRSGSNYLQVQTNTATVPTASDADAATSASCWIRATSSSAAPHDHHDPATGQPFPGNIIPANRLSAQRPGDAERLSAADAGLPPGHEQRDLTSAEPAGSAQGQHPARLPPERQQPVHLPLFEVQLEGRRRVPRHLPLSRAPTGTARTRRRRRAGRARSEQPDQRVQLHVLARRGLHQRLHRDRPLSSAASTGSTIRTSSRRTRRSRTRFRRSRSPASRHRRRSVSLVLAAARSTPVVGRDHLREGPPHVQGRRRRSSTRAKTTSTRSTSTPIPGGTNNQNGQFAVHATARAAGTGRRRSPTWRSALFKNYAETRPARVHQVARRSRPTSSCRTPGSRRQPDRRRRRPLGALAAVVLADQ